MSRRDDETEPKFNEIVDLGDYRFHFETMELQSVNGDLIPLRHQSSEVLAYLAARPGQIVSKDALIDTVWGTPL